VKAPQFTDTKGFSARGLKSWIARATSSFPVPDSPVTSTVDCTCATCLDHLVKREHAFSCAR
jgi:hypothetical protein